MKKKSIVTQTVWRVSSLFIVTIILLVVFFTGYITTYMKDTILKSHRTQVDTVADFMETRLESMIGPIISLAEYGPTARLVTNYYEPYTSKWLDNIRNIDAYLQNVSMFTQYIADINLLSADTKTVYSLNDVVRKDYDYINQEWFQNALLREGFVKYAPPHGTDHFYRKNEKLTFSMIYPIQRSKTVIGYVMIECYLFEIADFLKSVGDESGGYILLDAENQTIFRANQRTSEHLPDEILNNMTPEKSKTFQSSGNFYTARRLGANNWTIILQNGREFIMKPIRHLLLAVAVLGGITLTVLLCIISYNAQIVRRPFDALIGRINSYDGSGSVEIIEYDKAPRELAVIGERFEHMADKMNDLIQKVYVAELKQREAELEALMNQINPHFLYNVFQLIQTKAVLADNREIEDMIQALSQMMRYTMERKQDKVKIREELDYVRNYLMFYKVRFPKLFVYEIDCPEELLECRTLKFILQPIVENCLKHAFDRQKTGGIIKISIQLQEEDLVFQVYDNGRGMEEKRLREVTERLEQESYDGGIGIVNTNARIRLTYGENYKICIESRENEFTRVTVRIRCEGKRECTAYC